MTILSRRRFASALLLSLWVTALPAQEDAGKRVIDLQGQSNFRDLGGYEAADGRHVKWGMIYRSGELSHLTDADYQRLKPLDIRTIYDLRDQGERASQPTVWNAGPISTFASAKSGEMTAGMSALADPNIDAPKARAVLVDFYAQVPSLYAPEYRVIVHELLEGHAPLLLHCTAGKDRSGVASALILSALGVPRATVLQDYELTNQLLKPPADPPKTEFMRRFQSLPPDVRKAMMGADPAYLAASFQSIDAHYGSLQQYFTKELRIGPKDIDRLRSLYLQ